MSEREPHQAELDAIRQSIEPLPHGGGFRLRIGGNSLVTGAMIDKQTPDELLHLQLTSGEITIFTAPQKPKSELASSSDAPTAAQPDATVFQVPARAPSAAPHLPGRCPTVSLYG